MMLICIMSFVAVNAFDYFTVGAAFDPTLNIFESQYFEDHEKKNVAKVKYNTKSFGLDFSFGTIYDKDHYYKKLYEEKEDKIDASFLATMYNDDYSFTQHNVTIYYTTSGNGAIDDKTLGLNNTFDSNDVKLQGFKITYDLSWNKKHTLSDNVAFYGGIIPWSCGISWLKGDFEGLGLTAFNIDIWRFGFNFGFQIKVNDKGNMIKIGARPMITLFEWRTLKTEDESIKLYTEPFRQYNMFRNITCPITLSYVWKIKK